MQYYMVQFQGEISISLPLLRNYLENSGKMLLIYTGINNLYLKHEVYGH